MADVIFSSSSKCDHRLHKQVISIYIPVRVSSIPPNFRWPCLYVNKLFFISRETSSLVTFFSWYVDAKGNALPCYSIQIIRVSQSIDLTFDLLMWFWSCLLLFIFVDMIFDQYFGVLFGKVKITKSCHQFNISKCVYGYFVIEKVNCINKWHDGKIKQ